MQTWWAGFLQGLDTLVIGAAFGGLEPSVTGRCQCYSCDHRRSPAAAETASAGALVPVRDLLRDVGAERVDARHLGVERRVLRLQPGLGCGEPQVQVVLIRLVVREIGVQAGPA